MHRHRHLRSLIRAFLLLMLTGLLGLLSGCVQGRMDVKINENGSCDLDYRLADKGLDFLKENPVNQLRVKAEAEGFRVSDYRDGEYQGFRAVKHLTNISRLPDFRKNVFREGGGDSAFVARKGFFSSIYRFKTGVNFKYMSYLTDHGIDSITMKRIRIVFRLTLPGKIVATNADRSLADGRTVEWTLKAGKNAIYAESEAVHYINIALLIAAVLVGLVFGYIYFTRGETFMDEHPRG